ESGEAGGGEGAVRAEDEAEEQGPQRGRRVEDARRARVDGLLADASEWPATCLDAQLEACAGGGFRPRFVVESEDHTTAQGFVAAGPGVGLVPRLGLGSPHPGAVVRRLTGPEPPRSLHAAVRETAPPNPALRTFVKALREAADASGPRQTVSGATP
ncbi:MAG TPA: LysR substrate-binding domain-containing protein, partial [Streptomyces sp.]|nr:LysR substrate-binding domain-containing protein [Streptomyces sp.]